MSEAKKRFFLNISTNFITVIIEFAIGIYLTKFQYDKLGIAVAGIIPLIGSIINWFSIITQTIGGSLNRYTAMAISSGDIHRSNVYFNSSLVSTVFISILLLIPLGLLSLVISDLLEIPKGLEKQTSFFLLMVGLSVFIKMISSCFQSSLFIRHRFELDNAVRASSKLIQFGVIFLCFILIQPSIIYCGTAYVSSTLWGMLLTAFIMSCLTPEISIKPRLFEFKAAKEIMTMSSWFLVDQLGMLLYYSCDLIIINKLIGPVAAGLYAPFVQVATMISVMASTVSSVFSPIIYEYTAKRQMESLIANLKRMIRYLGILIALPIGCICGFGEPLMKIWLGPEFGNVSNLLLFLVMPQLLYLSMSPIFAVNRGFNKVKVPASVTCFGGILNIVISITLVKYTRLGIYGVALGTLCSLMFRYVIFSLAYTASILRVKYISFIKESFSAILALVLTYGGSKWICSLFKINSIFQIVAGCIVISIIYLAFSWFLLSKKEDRQTVSIMITGSVRNKFN